MKTFLSKFLVVLVPVFLVFQIVPSNAAEVAFAGFAYSGDHQSITARFPYSKRFEATLKTPGMNGLLQQALVSVHPQDYSLTSRIDELKGRDQAVAVALVMTNETVSTELIGGVHKLFVQLRGQALYFDFKSMTILRAYPFSFAYLDTLSAVPTDKNKDASVANVYLGTNGKLGIIGRFSQALTTATLPTSVSRFVQVSSVAIGDDARMAFPTQYENGAAEAWVADTFSEAIANRMGIPILPYSSGYAIGNVMSMTVADGTVYSLKLPEADYKFSLNVSKLKKVVFDEQAAGKSLIYGSYLTLKLEEPLSSHTYLNGQFKNGEAKVVSAMQLNTDDFPAYQDSMRGLFTKLSGVIAGDGNPWLKSAASGNDIDAQILATRELLKSCK